MKKIAAIVALASTVGASQIAQAETTKGLYGGVSFVMVNYEEDGFEASPSVISFKLGNRITENLAIEARLGTGLTDDTEMGVDVEVDSFIGVYAKAIAPLADGFELYGMIGYTRGELTASGFGMSVSDDDSDFSYGVGGTLAVTEKVAINGEYARLFSGTDYDVDALSIGVELKF